MEYQNISLLEDKEVENVFLDLIEKNERIEVFFNIISQLSKSKRHILALNLLKLLKIHCEEKKDIDNVVEIQKKILNYEKTDDSFKELVKYYSKSLNVDYHHLLDKVKDKDNNEAILLLDKYLFFKPGSFFLSNLFGLGRVINLDVKGDNLLIDFNGKTYQFNIHTETAYLKKIPNKHFLVKKYTDPEGIRQKIFQNPVDVLKSIVCDYKKISENEIKDILCDLVNGDFDAWWKKYRTQLSKEKDIKVHGGKTRIFEIIDEEDMEREYLLQYNSGDIYQKIKTTEATRKKELSIYNVLLDKMKNEIDNLKDEEKCEVFFYLYDIGEISQNELHTFLQKTGKDKLWKTILSFKLTKFKKMLFEYLLNTSENEIEDVVKKDMDYEMFEHFLKIRENKVSNIFDYLNENYKKYSEKYVWLIKYMVDKKCLPSKCENIFLNLVDILYNSKELRKYSEIVNDLPFEFLNIEENAALELQDKINEIFENNKNMKLGIRKKLHQLHPHLLFYENEIIYSTANSILKKEEELNFIRQVEIPKNSEEIAKARAEGDLSENFEYKAAKEKHSFLFSKVAQLTYELQHAVPIENFKDRSGKITLGNKVTLKNESETINFTILGIWDSAPENGIISYKSQIAGLLLGKQVGDTVKIEEKNYKIEEVTSSGYL